MGIPVLLLVILLLAGCGTVTLDASVEYDRDVGTFCVHKDPDITWENIEIVLNHKYTFASSDDEFTMGSDDGSYVLLRSFGFVDGDKYFNPETTKPIHFKISCDLVDGKHGEYIEICK